MMGRNAKLYCGFKTVRQLLTLVNSFTQFIPTILIFKLFKTSLILVIVLLGVYSDA